MNHEEKEKLKITRKGFLVFDTRIGYWLSVNGVGHGYTSQESKAGVFSLDYITRTNLSAYPSIKIIELK